jgi:hypothetical protein
LRVAGIRELVELDEMKESENKTGIHEVHVSAFPQGFLHSICEVSKSIASALRGDSDRRTQSINHGRHVNILYLIPPSTRLSALSIAAAE